MKTLGVYENWNEYEYEILNDKVLTKSNTKVNRLKRGDYRVWSKESAVKSGK